MESIAGPTSLPNIMNFPGPIGTKRRRMRSGGNVSTLSNNNARPTDISSMDDDDDETTTHTSKCKGATTIPIFLKKTYKMIDTCDPNIASWTADGEMFVVKDPDTFASLVIPQYFDHNKFSSFARQLNFYGFRKMQSKPIRNSDFDAATAKHVTFFNENFKRGRCDLLKNIQRSTRGGGTTGTGDAKEVQQLREQVSNLEHRINTMNEEFEERMRRLELDMLSRMEQMMLALQQQQQTQLQLQSTASVGTISSAMNPPAQNWDMNPFRGTSISSISFQQQPQQLSQHQQTQQQPQQAQQQKNTGVAAPSLPPHPKMKQLPMNGMLPPGGVGAPNRLNSLRGISSLTRGLSAGLSRGLSTDSTASAVLMKNSWEDKFFSMLMLGEGEQGNQNHQPLDGSIFTPTPLGPSTSISIPGMGPNMVSNDSSGGGNSMSRDSSGRQSNNSNNGNNLSPV